MGSWCFAHLAVKVKAAVPTLNTPNINSKHGGGDEIFINPID